MAYKDERHPATDMIPYDEPSPPSTREIEIEGEIAIYSCMNQKNTDTWALERAIRIDFEHKRSKVREGEARVIF